MRIPIFPALNPPWSNNWCQTQPPYSSYMIHWSPTVYPAKCQSPMHHMVLTPNLDESSGNSSCVRKHGHTTCSSEFFIIVIAWLWISFAFLYQSNLCCLQRVQIDVKHDAFIQSRQRGVGGTHQGKRTHKSVIPRLWPDVL